MIQRIQTLLLVLAAGLNVAVLFLPLGAAFDTDSMEGATVELYGSSMKMSKFDEENAFVLDNPFIEETMGAGENTMLLVHVILIVATSLFLLFVIFLFNNRGRQLRMAYAGIVMLMIQAVVAALLFMQLPDLIGDVNELRHDIAYGFFFPVGSILLTLFAARRIRHDENLVKSSDRIR